MSKSKLIWVLGVIGWVLSWFFFAKWLFANEWDYVGGWVEAFTASIFATGLLVDLVVTSLMLVALALWDRRRIGSRWAAAVILTLGLSVSVSLAVYIVALLRAAQSSALPGERV